MVSVELGVELEIPELKNMYIINKNSMNEGMMYILSRSSLGLVLKLLESITSWKDRFLYILGDLC